MPTSSSLWTVSGRNLTGPSSFFQVLDGDAERYFVVHEQGFADTAADRTDGLFQAADARFARIAFDDMAQDASENLA